MRLVKLVRELPSEYLHAGETYELSTLNPDPGFNVYFQRAGGPYPCGTYVRIGKIKKALREGALVFVD